MIGEKTLARRMKRVSPSAIMELLKTASGGGYINLASGLPDGSLFPHDVIRGIADDILSRDWQAALQYGAAEGYPPLREWVAQRLKQRGIDASSDQVLITNGSQQALDLAARLFLNENQFVALESPSYLAAIQAFDSYEVNYVASPMDADGVNSDCLIESLQRVVGERIPVLLFMLPNFQNPTGITLSIDRRKRIAKVAAELNVPLIEDDAYHDLRYDGDSLPPITSLSDNPFALYTGTFSKTIAPGLRVGWIYGSAGNILRIAQLKQITDLHTGSLSQRIAYEFCVRGHLDPQIQTLCHAYRAKRDTMLHVLEREMPEGVSWTRPKGGMFVFLTLPAAMNGAHLLRDAMSSKLMFVPGRSFFPAGSDCDTSSLGGGLCSNTLRLNFVSATNEEIEEGIKILGTIVRRKIVE